MAQPRCKAGASSSPNGTPDIIERIGMGPAQLRVICLAGGVWFADGAELLLVGTVARAVSEEWNLLVWHRGAVVSIVIVGILLGNMLSGPFGDSYGRRLPIVMSYAGIALFGVMSSFATTFPMFACLRLMAGISMGLGQPASSALLTEIAPAAWRPFIVGAAQSLFIVGEGYSVLLVMDDDPSMRSIHWRWLLLVGAIPSSILAVLSFRFLHQSPAYLASQGDYAGANEVLEAMRSENGAGPIEAGACEEANLPLRPFAPKAPAQTESKDMLRQLKIVFGRHMLFSTLACIYSAVLMNAVFYGCLYVFPQILPMVDMGMSPGASLMAGTSWEVPGIAVSIMLASRIGRRPLLALYLALVSTFLIGFAVGAWHQSIDHQMDFLVRMSYAGIKASVQMGCVTIYLYVSEIYPTTARATGISVCLSGGRLGGMAAPMVFEAIMEKTGGFLAFFHLLAGLAVFNLLLVMLLPFETANAVLDEKVQKSERTKLCS